MVEGFTQFSTCQIYGKFRFIQHLYSFYKSLYHLPLKRGMEKNGTLLSNNSEYIKLITNQNPKWVKTDSIKTLNLIRLEYYWNSVKIKKLGPN